ncbi:hypothetical protein COO91_00311 [Nostoc flagelliforme CCNUN1]|uniref:Uncharacterized protein n=1 Tax=Nostoc flagelliforme CCNUN1 TaxID=2038116 RepID=A0A2K8SGB9_9NOSO|nr:hypothetical protein [Nostoc flagelliforme]AUB34488.1 hypothetical protein COO91_00311 [Nostoc flagelliforme CCNUN1]
MEEYLSAVEMVFHQGEKLAAENADFGSRPSDIQASPSSLEIVY